MQLKTIQVLPLSTILLCCSFLMGCKESLEPRALAFFVENEKNGLVQFREVEDLELKVQYKPIDYQVVIEKRKEILSSDEVNAVRKELDGLLYFNFSFRLKNGESTLKKLASGAESKYGGLIRYISVHMQDDFKLVAGEDTLNCVLYHFERNYGMLPFETVSIAFEALQDEETDLQLIYDDRIFNIGRQQFTIKEESLYNLPSLKLM